jgi:large subunit ribosomal protein L29
MVTSAEISEYDIDELETRLSETRRELFNLRFQLATGQLDNFSRLQHVRKDIARMLTELRSREIAEAEGMLVEELPAHRAAARIRSEDEALGRTRTTASARRAAAKAEAEDGTADDGEAEDGTADDGTADDSVGTTDDPDTAVGDEVAEAEAFDSNDGDGESDGDDVEGSDGAADGTASDEEEES